MHVPDPADLRSAWFASEIIRGAAAGGATRQSLAAVAAALFRLRADVPREEPLVADVAHRVWVVIPVLAEHACATQAGRLPRVSGAARKRRNVAMHSFPATADEKQEKPDVERSGVTEPHGHYDLALNLKRVQHVQERCMDHVAQQATHFEERLLALEQQLTSQAQFSTERLEGIAGHITDFGVRLHGLTARLGKAMTQLSTSIGELTSRVEEKRRPSHTEGLEHDVDEDRAEEQASQSEGEADASDRQSSRVEPFVAVSRCLEEKAESLEEQVEGLASLSTRVDEGPRHDVEQHMVESHMESKSADAGSPDGTSEARSTDEEDAAYATDVDINIPRRRQHPTSAPSSSHAKVENAALESGSSDRGADEDGTSERTDFSESPSSSGQVCHDDDTSRLIERTRAQMEE